MVREITFVFTEAPRVARRLEMRQVVGLRTLVGKLRTACFRTVDTVCLALRLRDPLVPPHWMFRDPDRVDGSHTPEEFSAIGRGTVQWLIDYEGLKPTHRFLDVGCGIGRMAIPLVDYLQTGKYHGFDIREEKIAYCRRTVGRKRPDFAFRHADVFNKYYNPRGRMQASDTAFRAKTRASISCF